VEPIKIDQELEKIIDELRKSAEETKADEVLKEGDSYDKNTH